MLFIIHAFFKVIEKDLVRLPDMLKSDDKKYYFKVKTKVRGNILASAENYDWNMEIINIIKNLYSVSLPESCLLRFIIKISRLSRRNKGKERSVDLPKSGYVVPVH